MPRKAKTPEGKRYPLNMRTTRELRDQIEAAAHLSGRSLVQEVEYRLEQSFVKANTKALLEELANKTATASTSAVKDAIYDLFPNAGKKD